MKYYAGIGPRKTPAEVQGVMTDIAAQLVPTGWCLRSGHAEGADQAFERGARIKQIFLPWEGFNGARSNGVDTGHRLVCGEQLDIAARHYEMDPIADQKPSWDELRQGARMLLARNVLIILGEILDDPVSCVITWSPTVEFTGGTGHAIRIAETYGIPIFNLNWREDQNAMCKFILNANNRSQQVAA